MEFRLQKDRDRRYKVNNRSFEQYEGGSKTSKNYKKQKDSFDDISMPSDDLAIPQMVKSKNKRIRR